MYLLLVFDLVFMFVRDDCACILGTYSFKMVESSQPMFP